MSDATPMIIGLSIGLSIFTLVAVAACYRRCCRKPNRGVVFSHNAPVVVTSQSHAPQRTAGTVQQSTYYPPQQGTAPPGGLNYTPQQGMYPPQTAPYPPQTLPYPSAQQPAMPQPQAPYPVHENAPVVGVQPPIGFNQDPPSYDQVTQGDQMYTKQPAYNPNYSGQH